MSDYERMIEEDWDRAEAEMLEQVSLIPALKEPPDEGDLPHDPPLNDDGC